MFAVQETIIVYCYLSYNCKFWNGSSVYTVELEHPFANYIYSSF